MPAIPLFVSSTFSDFHAERDSIRDVVVPRLNAEVKHFGCRIELVDLRAGVQGVADSESESDLRVLEVCAQEIERSHPSFVVLVGTRGGWTPRADFARTLLGSRGLEAVDDLSVTEIEVLLARRSAQEPSALTAFFRTDHPDYSDAWRERKEAAETLRSRIAADPSFAVTEYSAPPVANGSLDLHEFERLVEERLRPALIARARALATADDPIRRATMLFRETRRPFQDAYNPVAREVTEHLNRGASVCIFGDSGVGTSTAWCTTLDVVAKEFDVRAVAVRGTDIAVKVTDVIRHVLQRPQPGDDIERQVDLASLFVLGSTSDPDLHEMRTRDVLAHDLALAGLHADPPLLVAIDAVEEVFSASDRTAILDASMRPEHVRWLISTSDPEVRDDLVANGFAAIEVTRLNGEQLLHAVGASTRALAPGRRLPASAIESLAGEPRTAAWIEAAARILLRPSREELETLPSGDGWMKAFDVHLIQLARNLSSDVADLRSHAVRRVASLIGEDSVALLLSALMGSYLGLSRDVLAEVVDLSVRDVARVAAMLDPIIRTTIDDRLMVGDVKTVRSLVGDPSPSEVRRIHERAAEALTLSGLPDTSSQVECLWHLSVLGRDIGPVLELLTLGTLPPDGPADTATLDRILHIVRRCIDTGLVIASVDDTTALLVSRLASRSLRQSSAVETLGLLRDAVAQAGAGNTAQRLTEAVEARIAMAEFADHRHTQYFERLLQYLAGLNGRSAGNLIFDWELTDVLWATSTLIPMAIRNQDVAGLRALLGILERTESELINRSSGTTRHRVIFSLAYVRRLLTEEVRRVHADLGLQIRDRATEDLRWLAQERPSDDSVRRLLIDVLLVIMGPADAVTRDRIREAVDLLTRISAERRSETEWLRLRGDALLLQSQQERRFAGRASEASRDAASEAESVFRSLHRALPCSPVATSNLARCIAERVAADPSTHRDSEAQSGAKHAMIEAEELVAEGRRTGERDLGSRRSDAESIFTVAQVMVEHDRVRAIRLLNLARDDYQAAVAIYDSDDLQARIARTFTVQAECELGEAKAVASGPDGLAELARWANLARESAKAGLRILGRVGPPGSLGGDAPRLRFRLWDCLAEAVIIPVERAAAVNRRDLMEAARTLEQAADTVLFGNEWEQQRELRPAVRRLIERLLALEVDGRRFGSRGQRNRWDWLKRALEIGAGGEEPPW